jgi:hypothetical protein
MSHVTHPISTFPFQKLTSQVRKVEWNNHRPIEEINSPHLRSHLR